MHARRLCAVAATSWMLVSGPAHAVTQIDNTEWTSQSSILPLGSSFWVTFVARTTSLDIGSGVTFSIHERDPDGNDVLLDIALPWTAPYPSVGTEIRVTTDYRLVCASGSLLARHVGQWFVSWCDLDSGAQVRSGSSGIATRTGTSEPESFEFVLVDEDGVEAGPTAEDVYRCAEGTLAKSESPFMSPYELVQQGSSITSASSVPRGDPGVHADNAGTIQIAFDPKGNRMCGQIPAGTPATLYVVAQLAGPTLCGITGAELRVVGIPADWIATATPAGAVSLGDPLGPVGGNVAFTSCQSPAKGPVLLYTISLFATSSVTDHTIEVIARTPPTNPSFDCPLVTLCDAPLYSIVCMERSRAVVNSRADGTCGREHRPSALGPEARELPQSLATSTWSTIKRLYR